MSRGEREERVSEMDHAEQEIRRLTDDARDAMLDANVEALDRICAEGFVVTNPLNLIWNKRQVLDAVRSGRIKHTSFDRRIEYLRIYGDTAVVMGEETVVDAGPTMHRRYTDVWMKQAGRWQIIARHANLIAPR